tara:strand:+ start:434 stop:538 length:105 start_codon:yes stop_codon:yes gene_type:complete
MNNIELKNPTFERELQVTPEKKQMKKWQRILLAF